MDPSLMSEMFINVDSAFGSVRRVDVGSVSEVYAARIFIVEVIPCSNTHPEDGTSMYPRKIGNTAYVHTVQRLREQNRSQ
jgi:hypothetical protein